MRLTDISIKALKAPPAGAIIYNDDLVMGFGVRVSEGGTKSFVLTHGVRRQRETLGRVGIVSLQEARTAAKRRLAEYTLGKQVPTQTTWNDALTRYLAHIKQNRRASTLGHYRRFLKKYFRFGETKLSAITAHDISQRLDKLADRKGEHQTAFAIVRAFLNWCERRDLLERNPVRKLSEPHKYKPRRKVLDDDALRKVWVAAGSLNSYGEFVRLLILTGQRRTECASLTPAMDGGDRITLPGWLTKNHKEHTFPVGPMARTILDSRVRQPLYFPAGGSTDKLMSGWSKMKERLDTLAGLTGWRLHDLRRTLRTNWARLGIPKDIAKRYINHARERGDMDEVYDQYGYFSEMKAAVEKWEAFLQTLLI